jgi:hypothetical protein
MPIHNLTMTMSLACWFALVLCFLTSISLTNQSVLNHGSWVVPKRWYCDALLIRWFL